MKRILSIIISVCMVLLLCVACGNAGETSETEGTTMPTMDPNLPLSDGKTLKVLAIGNSFSNNTTQYLYDVAKAEGMTEIVLGRLYISGCSLATHLKNAQTDAAAYRYDKNTTGAWKEAEPVTLLYALKDEDWDIITFQQASGSSGQADTYSASIAPLVEYVTANKTNPTARYVWNMTWAYQQGSTKPGFAPYDNDQMTMYNAIIDAVQKVIVPMEEFHSIIPVGTAIQNVRTSFIGDNVTKDTFHLNTLGDVIGAYTWYAVFTGKPLEAIHLDLGSKLTLTDNDKAAIIEAINAAIKTPFAVTQSTVTG